MIKAKQVNIKKNKYFTVDMNDLDPFLLDIKKKNLLKKLIFITLIIFKKNLIVAFRYVLKLILLQDILEKKMMINI